MLYPTDELFLQPVRSSSQLQFEHFYAARLRPALGKRISATELRDGYLRHALPNGFGSLSFWQIAVAMEEHGHRRYRSNGMLFCDVEWKEAGEAHPPTDIDLAAEIRSIMARLAQIERLIAPPPPPMDRGKGKTTPSEEGREIRAEEQ